MHAITIAFLNIIQCTILPYHFFITSWLEIMTKTISVRMMEIIADVNAHGIFLKYIIPQKQAISNEFITIIHPCR